MAAGKEIRGKIKSVENTKKITKAMEMVAASKMRKAQERMRAARPYAEKVRSLAANLSQATPEYKHPFMVAHDDAKLCGFIVVTTDKGLCGGMNTNVLRLVAAKLKELGNPTWHDDSRRFELITLPFQDFAAMNKSLELILDIGIPEIAAHLQRVQQPLLDLAARRDIPITSPRGSHGCAIVCLKAPGAARLHGVLRRNEVICSLREGSLRFSPHLFNSVDDVARAAAVLEANL